ncbi:MAG: cytochrome C oxidase subunit IV family protein [Cytophagales bacterium]|nr:cytochrome C oxidase subunit IV family protein [Cytophagales bacterium]
MEDKLSVQVPDSDNDYHGHPNYLKIYIALLVFFGISLGVVSVLPLGLAVVVIFLVAIVKAWLVVANFMHLKFEPFLIVVAVLLVLFILLAFFWGVYPDITIRELDISN